MRKNDLQILDRFWMNFKGFWDICFFFKFTYLRFKDRV